VRHVVGRAGLGYDAPAPFAPGERLGDALLYPTRIYVKSCLAAIRAGGVRALAHITGGGLVDNIPRVVPEGLGVRIEAGAWPIPPVFRWLATAGDIGAAEMARTFNCGIGMVAIVAAGEADAVERRFAEAGESVHRIGSVARRAPDAPEVEIAGWDALWRA
jgi:phosphoribosylformylglycinamidine cyclo-ligase